jgi:hypothetical protein
MNLFMICLLYCKYFGLQCIQQGIIYASKQRDISVKLTGFLESVHRLVFYKNAIRKLDLFMPSGESVPTHLGPLTRATLHLWTPVSIN